MADVDITQRGRGGTIYYREHGDAAVFHWEFAGSAAIALVFGPRATEWDRAYAWAAGRQRDVFETVGREVVRQRVSGGSFSVDLDSGTITVLRAAPPPSRSAPAPSRPTARSAAWERFVASVVPSWSSWPDGSATYDVEAAAMSGAERDEAVETLLAREPTWREVDALAALGTPRAWTVVTAAADDRRSVATRLAAHEALHRRDPSHALDAPIAAALRALHRAHDGLDRALRLAAAHDGPTVRQALLWASWNQTECSSPCAALLLRLAAVPDPSLAERLGLHESERTRRAAFDALCERVGMTLDE